MKMWCAWLGNGFPYAAHAELAWSIRRICIPCNRPSACLLIFLASRLSAKLLLKIEVMFEMCKTMVTCLTSTRAPEKNLVSRESKFRNGTPSKHLSDGWSACYSVLRPCSLRGRRMPRVRYQSW